MTLIAATVLAAISAWGTAWAAPGPVLTVSWSPASAVAGSSDNLVTITFLATESKEGLVTVSVPGAPAGTPWSRPQTVDPSAAGFVAVQSLGCNTASLAGVSSDGTVTISFKCATRKSFALSYRATAATTAGTYAFATRERVQRSFLPTTVQPVVNVGPGSLAQFTITGLVDAAAGTAQSATATAQDAHGNALPGYNGTAAITSSDTLAVLPAPAPFTNGSRTFAISLRSSGLQSVAATDGAATGSQAVTIAAGPATSLRLDGVAVSASAGAAQAPTVTLLDQYLNVATGYRGTVRFALTAPTEPRPDNSTPAASGDAPADHTFTGADAGTHVFSGLQLRTMGTWGISVADVAASQLSAGASQLVLPGPVTSLDLTFPSPWLPFAFQQFAGQGHCRLTPRDAHGNYVNTYAGTVRWTTTAENFALPAEGPYLPFAGLIGANNPYVCMLLSPGTHQLTATDVGNPSLTDTVVVEVVPPSPQADSTTVQHPTKQGGFTMTVLSPMQNDAENQWRSVVLRLDSIGQATFTSGGATYQLGVARVDSARLNVVWELNPPDDAVATVPGATLARCEPDGAGCDIAEPISMTYTITDTISTASSTIDLSIEPGGGFLLSLPPALGFAAWDQGIVPSDQIGTMIPTANLVLHGPLLFNVVTGHTNIPLAAPIPCANGDPGCSITTTATASLPQFVATGTPTGVNLSQSLDVVGLPQSSTFRSVQTSRTGVTPQSSYIVGIGALVNIGESKCYDQAGQQTVCWQNGHITVFGLSALVGKDMNDVQDYLIRNGMRTDSRVVCTTTAINNKKVVSIDGFTPPPDQSGRLRVGTLVSYTVSILPGATHPNAYLPGSGGVFVDCTGVNFPP